MAIYQIADRIPDIAPTAWVHDSATVIGSVVLSDRVSVWPQAVIRGDTETITIGPGSNVQDGAVLHADPGVPLTLGAEVTIGHQVMLHGCTIGDGTLVGIQAIVLNNAVIGRGCLVGAGSLVTEGKVFPDNVMIVGSPARVIRELTPDDVARVRHAANHYVEEAVTYRDHAVRIDVPASASES
jgi:carbonic anhydrase/acetyltransferase-like protein (isoleucine patch superfamily)